VGGRREPETAAGVSCGGGAPASGERRGRAGEVRWGQWKVRVVPISGGRGLRRQSRGGPKLDGANGGAAAKGRASRTEAALYRQMGREEGPESKHCFDFELLRGGGNQGTTAAAEVPAGGAGNTAGGVALGQGASRGG
jgi:hypothetical protein